QLILAGVLAVVFAQLAFLAHDAAHRQIFRSGRANEWAALILGTLLGGLSAGWWQNKHTRHHANPNKLGSDTDIVTSAGAFTPDACSSCGRRGWFLADWHAWFYYPMLLREVVNLHVDRVG